MTFIIVRKTDLIKYSFKSNFFLLIYNKKRIILSKFKFYHKKNLCYYNKNLSFRYFTRFSISCFLIEK